MDDSGLGIAMVDQRGDVVESAEMRALVLDHMGT